MYHDQLECPHCHKTVELDIEIEGDDGYMNLCPIVIPRKGVVNPKDYQQTHWDRLETRKLKEGG